MAAPLRTLIKRLNPVCYAALESAGGLCLSRSHYEVDLEHFFAKLLEGNNTDLHQILSHYDQNQDRVRRDLDAAMDKFKTGNTRTPVFSPRIQRLLEAAWMVSSVDFEAGQIRSAHILIAALRDTEFAMLLERTSEAFGAINPEQLKDQLDDITGGSMEAVGGARSGSAEGAAQQGGPVPSGPAGQGELGKYTINLTERAKAGQIDPVLGRDAEIRQMVDILSRRRQNNPILTGEAGVGKTAVVEGLAQRIADDDVPPILKGVTLLTLDLGLLQAGASVKGEFERRLRAVIDEVKASKTPIIMFIDEAHTLIGAGGAAGQGDAANLLKPALARGELRTIAATTWSEYKKYFEKDPALTRRFQVVKVEEPDEARATAMIRGVANTMETHHKVRVLDEAVRAAVSLSNRYLAGRQLPDKAVSLLDTACARVKISQNSTPAPIEDIQRQLENIAAETRALEREQKTGADHGDAIAKLAGERTRLEGELATLKERWSQEKALVDRIDAMRRQLEGAPGEDKPAAPVQANGDAAAGAAQAAAEMPAEPATREALAGLTHELRAMQGEVPLVYPVVTDQTVAEVLSGWTGIPLGSMVKDEIAAVLELKDRLAERVIGQDHALDIIAQRIRTARANLDDPGKPIGVFMLVGTSGVGKTETALALTELLYGGERNIISINMSEYQEAHTVSNLKGSPRGYVGYGEGGVLTEAVRRRPYSVVLLDEVEKAHPDVMELFFQVFDKGDLEDAEGRSIDFKNTVIILTSNVGTDTIMTMCGRGKERPQPDAIIDAIRPELNSRFKPALLGRMVVVPFYPINDQMLDRITRLKLNKIVRRVEHNHGAFMSYDDAVVQALCARCTDTDSGARTIDNILTGSILPEIAQTVLQRMAEGQDIEMIKLKAEDGGAIGFEVS
ncbi:MAG: type VI secretion system ATPase TssH [Alphaproteobacteria bacterium]